MCLSMHGCIIIPQGTKIRINLTFFFFRFLPSNFEIDCWFLKQFLDFRALCFVWWTPCIVQLQLSRRRRRESWSCTIQGVHQTKHNALKSKNCFKNQQSISKFDGKNLKKKNVRFIRILVPWGIMMQPCIDRHILLTF